MKPQSAKAKGRKLQQWLRDQLYERFDSFRDGDVRSTGMGQSGSDVRLSPHARDVFPYSVEAKSYKKHTVYNYLEQAQSHVEADKARTTPLALLKMNYKDPVIAVDAVHFLDILQELHELREIHYTE